MQKFYDNQISIFITKNVVLNVILLRYSRYANVAIVRLDDILTIYQKKKKWHTRHEISPYHSYIII